ncbi:SRPBCC domain-containing protein [Conexibacter sp. SYSU D00693]|uniref:SRPBCC family protein n=1 Tax=Conexibacter sp. SYSU D00693 TaxID=2812560 RepID=UPI00196AAC7D|nr:SRPBCC domain-containing protein [Conexibacter sp. SYSU D00693]
MSTDRRVEVEVEVPATPEQAWEAIATGPGITAWFMPAEVEGRVGGAVVHRHESELETPGTVTAYEAPHRFAYEESSWLPDAEHREHVTATEWFVEARSGGTCVVRVVMSGFGDEDAWDKAMESYAAGWRQALLSLRLYLTHFPGERAASITAGGPPQRGDADAVWTAMCSDLGVPPEPRAGQRLETAGNGVPAFGGTVVEAGGRMVTLVLDTPAGGLGFLGAGGPGEDVFTFVRAQLFGDGTDAVAAREQAAWEAWFAGRSVRRRGQSPASHAGP